MRKQFITIASALLLGAGTLSLAACENEDPVEEAGEKISEAMDEAGDAIEEATEQQ